MNTKRRRIINTAIIFACVIIAFMLSEAAFSLFKSPADRYIFYNMPALVRFTEDSKLFSRYPHYETESRHEILGDGEFSECLFVFKDMRDKELLKGYDYLIEGDVVVVKAMKYLSESEGICFYIFNYILLKGKLSFEYDRENYRYIITSESGNASKVRTCVRTGIIGGGGVFAGLYLFMSRKRAV